METILEEHFQRVETALNTLIESITTYNPSVQAAIDLVAADDELSKGLEQLAQHQANHTRILQLRQTAESLDTQIKSTVSLLAETRKELLNTPFTAFPDSSRDVPFDELLAYAKMISRFTIPPTYRPAPPKLPEAVKALPEAEDVVMANGTPRSPPAVPTVESDSQQHLAAAAQQDVEKDAEAGLAFAKLSDEQKRFVNQMSELPFVPWPDTELIKRGALAKVQEMIEKGVDPTTVLGPREQEELDRRTREESDAARAREEEELRTRQRRGSVGGMGGAARREEKQEAFDGFALYDPEEDDD